MAFTNTVVKASYQGDGVTTTFAIPSQIIVSSSSEVKVYLRDETLTTATQELLTITTHYTISGSNVVMITAPATDEVLVITRLLPLTQTLDLITSGAFLPESHELAMDRLVAMIQQLDEKISRAPLAHISEQVDGQLDYGEPIPITVIGWDDTAEQVVLYSFDDITADVAEDLANHIADATDAHDASAISVSPSGNLSSTDVQAALLELQTHVDLFLGTSALTASRALVTNGSGQISVSSVTSTELGYVSGVTSAIQTQINTLSTSIANHISSGIAHTAANIVVVPAGNLAANDVQEALEELQTSIDGFTAGAPTNAQYVVLALHASLSGERVLTGTANQVVITDGGANGNVTLSLPQSIDTAATVQFEKIKLLGTTPELRIYEISGGGNYNAFRSPSLTSDYTYILPNGFPSGDRVLQSDSSGNLTWAINVGGLHNLLSNVHTDTVAASVVRGDLIIGNSTPAWSRLAIGASTRVLASDGTDPSWTVLTASYISDFSEAVDDRVAALIQNGTGLTWTYVDGSNTFTGNVSLGSFTTSNLAEGSNLYFTDERVDDRVAALVQNGTGLTWTYVDGSNTFTGNVSLSAFSTTNLAEGTNLYYTDERVDDRVSALIIAGTGISSVYSDVGNTLTISNTGVTSLIATANQTTVSGATGDVTIGTVQNIGTGSSPTFTGLTLSGLTLGSMLFAGSGGAISQDNANLFWDDTNNRLSIGSTANTLNFIGVSTGFQFSIHREAATTIGSTLYSSHVSSAIGTGMIFARSRGTEAVPTTLLNDDVILKLMGAAFSGATALQYDESAFIQIAASANHSSTSTPGRISFFTTGIGSLTASERVRIVADGTVRILGLSTGIAHFASNGDMSSSTIVNADVSASAAIEITKLANGTANQLIKANAGATANEFATLSGGTGLGVAFGVGTITLSNTGVTSAIGTANQVNVSGATGAVTFSTPQNIHTAATPTFSTLTLSGLTLGSVIFAGTAGLLSQDNSNFFWDDTNNRLGIGTTAPAEKLEIMDGNLYLDGTSSGGQIHTKTVHPINNPPYMLVIDRAATNLVPNPSFEVNTTGWTAVGANATISRITTDKYVGDACLRNVISPGTASQGARTDSLTVTSSSWYTFSFYVKIVTGTSLFVVFNRNVSGNSSSTLVMATGEWRRYAVTVQMGASDTSVQMNVLSANTGTTEWYIDGVQLELSSVQASAAAPTSYLDGSLDGNSGYTWSGTAHNSSSSRTAGLHFLGPETDTTRSNPFTIRRDGSVGGEFTQQFDSIATSTPWDFSSSLATANSLVTDPAVLTGTVKITNTGNGTGLYVVSATTTDIGMGISVDDITTGTALLIALNADKSSFTGEYFTFTSKSATDQGDWRWSKTRHQIGTMNENLDKYVKWYGGGLWSKANTAETGTIAQSGTTVTGTGTAFANSHIGKVYVPASGSIAVITAVASTTSMTVNVSQTIAAGTSWSTATSQYSPAITFQAGPSSDQRKSMHNDQVLAWYFDGNRHPKFKMPAVLTGSSTLTTTVNLSAFTTAANDSQITAGDWIYAAGMSPRQVLNYSGTSGNFRGIADASLAAVAYRVRESGDFSYPTSDADANSPYFNHNFYRESAGKTLTSNTSEQSWFTTTPFVPGGTFSTTRALRIEVYGTSSSTNAACTLTLRLKLGATTIVANTTASTTGSTALQYFKFESRISANGASAQNSYFRYVAGTDAAAPVEVKITRTATSSVNTAQDLALDVTSQFGGAAGQIIVQQINIYWE